MKKALIAIISAIYVIAIVLVSFLGSKTEVHNKTIYVTALELKNTTMMNPDNPSKYVVRIIERPDEEAIGDDGKDSSDRTWNVFDEQGNLIRKYDYNMRFYDLTYIKNNMQNEYKLDVRVKPDDATKKDLTYFTNRSNFISIDGEGMITFGNIPSLQTGYLNISSTDLSGVQLNIYLTLN